MTTGGEPFNSDDAFRAAQYLEAQKQHRKDVEANKAEKDLYKYKNQEAAKGVLVMEKEAKDLSKKEWEALIRFGVKLKDRDAPFMTILKKDIPFLCHYSQLHRASSTSRNSLKTKRITLQSLQSQSQSPSYQVLKRLC